MEHDEKNHPRDAGKPPGETEGTSASSPPDEGSVFGDMLNAMGFSTKKGKASKNNKSNALQASDDEKDVLPDKPCRIELDEQTTPDLPVRWIIDPDDLLNAHGPVAASFADEEASFFRGNSEGVNPTDWDETDGHDTEALLVLEAENEQSRPKPWGNKGASRTNPRKDKKKRFRLSLIATAVMLALAAGIYLYPMLSEPWPPGEDVVASYANKTILVEDLQNFIQLEGMKEQDHMICEVHGFDHSKCDQFEPCEQHPIDSLRGYRQMTQMLVMEQIIQAWADEKGISQREDVQHTLSDLFDDASVTQFMEQIHENEITPESIPKWEVQQYYDENRELYTGQAFSDVENEIRQLLVQQKDAEYFPQYIEELKTSAGLEVNFDLLQVTEPTTDEIAAYYQANLKDYQQEASAIIEEIRITSPEKASEAQNQLGAGESFENVAVAFSDSGRAEEVTVTRGSRDAAVEEAIWKLQPDEVSKALSSSDGSTSIVRLVRLNAGGARPLEEATGEIKALLALENMEREYAVNKTEALFSIDGKRYTLGEFYTEFKELAPEYQQAFSTFDTKKMLVEQYIAKELLLEESTDTTTTDRERHDLEDLRVQYLSQILHQEEVDGQLEEPTEEEIVKFYNENQELLVTPPSAKISLIWLSQGLQGETQQQALQRAQEALVAIRSGTDFADAAKTYSEDSTKTTGGAINEWLYEEYMPSEVAGVVFSLAPGEVSEVIDSMGGYYIIQLDEKRDAVQNTLEESRELIRLHLKDEKHAELEKGMEDTLLERYNLVIYDRTLRRMLQEQNATSQVSNNTQ